MTEFNQAVYEKRIDAMKARERNNIWAVVWLSRILDQQEANAERLVAYKRRRYSVVFEKGIRIFDD